MVKILKQAFLPLFLAGFLPAASAELGEVLFIWDNTRGFVPSESCKAEFTDKHDILAMGSGGFFLEHNIQVNTLDGTLVKMMDAKVTTREGDEPYRHIRVLTAPAEDEMVCDRVGKRGDIGYVAQKNLLPLSEFEVHLRSVKGVRAKVRESMKGLAGTVWRVSMSSGRKLYYRCKDRNYVVFNMFLSEEATAPVAQVGIWREQTEIFADVNVKRIALSKGPTIDKENAGKPIEGLDAELNPPPGLTMEEIRRVLKVPLPKGVYEQGEIAYAGQPCRNTDKDPLKCMICVINGEADQNSYPGMVAVAQTMMERLAHPLYPKDLCRIAHQPGQYVAVWNGRRITTDRMIAARMTAAAKEGMIKGGGGFTGFRSCSYLRGIGNNSGVDIGGNCFLKNGFLLPLEPGNSVAPPKQFAEKISEPRSS